MENSYSLSFRESKLILQRPAEAPGSRSEHQSQQESAEAAETQQREYRELVKDILKNPHERTAMIGAQSQGREKLRKFFEDYMVKYQICRKERRENRSANPLADLQGAERYRDVYLKDGKEIDINAYTNGIIDYLHSLGRNGRTDLRREAENEKASEERQRATAKPNEFVENNAWPTKEAANIANRFYSHVLKSVCDKALQREISDPSQRPKRLRIALNGVLNPGINIVAIRRNYSIDADAIKMNGPLAWPTIDTLAKRNALEQRLLNIVS